MRPKDWSAEGAEKIIVSRTEPKDHKSSNGVLLLRNMVMSLTVSESLYRRFMYGKTLTFLLQHMKSGTLKTRNHMQAMRNLHSSFLSKTSARKFVSCNERKSLRICLSLPLRPRFVRTWDWRKKIIPISIKASHSTPTLQFHEY